MYVAALAMGISLVTYVGCDAGKGLAARLKNEFDKGTVVLQIEGRLADAKQARADLKKIADDCSVEFEVVSKKIERLEEGKKETIGLFNDLREIAKNLELPAVRSDTTPEDLAKTTRIGTRTYTGEAII